MGITIGKDIEIKEQKIADVKDFKLLQGNCLDIMPTLPDRSIDLILADIPYGTTTCKWDTVINLDKMWLQLKRLTIYNSAIALFGSEPFSSFLRTSNIKMFKYDWIWKKTRPSNFFAAKFLPLNDKELISIFSEAGVGSGTKTPLKYYPQDTKKTNITTKNGANIGGKIGAEHNSPLGNRIYHQTVTNYPKNMIDIPNDLDTIHPTQKPVALMEYLIKTYTNEGETVLDFTMGSGTTGVACKNLNRKFIGIELDQKYFDIAVDRINNS